MRGSFPASSIVQSSIETSQHDDEDYQGPQPRVARQDEEGRAASRYVMKNGELFEGDTLNRIWPDPKPLPSLWWWDEKR
jgi:hypothetical protein